MTRVKICGITNVRDAESAMEAGADAIGLVFAPSPRRVDAKEAKKIAEAVGPWGTAVGVFVNEKIGTILEIAARCRLSGIQLHGEESPSVARRLSLLYRVIKAVRVAAPADVSGAGDYPAEFILWDTKTDGLRGGSGKSFDWKILGTARMKKPFIVSGGLNPGNVAKAVRLLGPYGVDVSSGVEKSPGKKDPRLVREFIRNAKQK
ncbi:MAG: phosphoribosylanthranilate isomerase [Candidatus Omnitrophica bacterium]|nr:phosphoribosylanthranilate isomerase [Candidatus Omnitrophota bacterium]